MNWVPVVSQLKSLTQFVAGDLEGARDTQDDFIRTCPIVSQVMSAVQACNGDAKGARETQVKFLHMLGGVIDGLPILGFLKAGVHYFGFYEKDRGYQSIKAASRTIGVIGCASAGFYLQGIFGAVSGGIFGGIFTDFLISGLESTLRENYVPYGIFSNLEQIDNDITHRAGHVFDLIACLVFDGVYGYFSGVGNEQSSKLISSIIYDDK